VTRSIDHEAIKELLQKVEYSKYYDDTHTRNVFERGPVNCVDSRIEKSRETSRKLKELKQRKIELGTYDTMKEIANTMVEFTDILAEDLEEWGLSNPKQFISTNVDLSRWKLHEKNGKKYVSIDPKIGNKYVGFNPGLKEKE